MSAQAIAARRSSAGIGHVVTLLGCCASLGMRALALVLAVLFGGLGALALATADESERVSVTLFLSGLAVASLWGIWFTRLVLLHAEARQSRMPDVPAAIGATLALAFVATAVLPGMLLAAGGIPAVPAVSTMAIAAMAGVLVATLPRILYMALCFAPLAFGLLHALLKRVPFPAAEAIAWRPGLDDIAWLLPPLIALAAWRWFAVVRQAGEPPVSSWWQPAITANPRPGAAGGWLSGSAWGGQMPDWMWPAGQTAGAGPADPVRAIRALVGTPFAPLSARQVLVQLGVAALAFAYLAVQSLEGDDNAGLIGGIIGGGGVLVVMYGQRLDAMYRKRAGETDELALLPGFGDAPAQRGHLLAAVSWSPMRATAAVLVLLVVMGLLAGLAPKMLALLLLSMGGLALVTALACLRPMAGLRMDGGRMLLIAGPGLLFAMITMIYAIQAEGAGNGPLVFALLWLLAYAIGGAALVSTFRRFRARPHPFLQD